MNKKQDKIIDYIKGFNMIDGEPKSILGAEVVRMNYMKRYYNCLYLLAGLSPCARNLMDYLTEEMDEDNEVRSDVGVRAKFISFITKITYGLKTSPTGIVYADPTVKSAFTELSSSGLIISRRKGVFEVNKKFFFLGKEEDRLNAIILEIKLKPENTSFRLLKVRDRK